MAIEPNPGGSKAIKSLLESIGSSQNGESNHEALTGLLGGNSSGHYHLTKEQLDNLSAHPDTITNNHEQLDGLLGGSINGHYHLTVDLLNKLINLPANGNSGGGGTVSISVGSVTTGAAGSNASVTNSGTSSNAVFDFVIPRGAKGDKGDKGDSGEGGGTAAAYKLVKKTFSENVTHLNDSNDNEPQTSSYFNVPEGVHAIYVSACAGGGGMYTAGGKMLTGWSGGQCPNARMDVNPGDKVTVRVGLGGDVNIKGQDTVILKNGTEFMRLRGGYSGNHSGIRPDDRAYVLNPPAILDGQECTYSPMPNALNAILNSASSNGISSANLISFLLEGFMSPRTMFSPYGEGGCFMHDIRGGENFLVGMPGIVILEYVEPVI